MNTSKYLEILKNLYDSTPDENCIKYILESNDALLENQLFNFADKVRKDHIGDGIYLRGIIEFSSFCRNTCTYCGLNRNNKSITRYRLTKDEILHSIKAIAQDNIKTVVLQSGEDDQLDSLWLADLIKKIKNEYDMAVTLSAGERTYDEYKLWREAGADRYLLKIETTDRDLYKKLHPDMSFDNRLNCAKMLRELGYQNGSGIIIGLKGQTLLSIARDIVFFKNYNFDMIGIGPFIPHGKTALKDESKGSVLLTLKVIALARIITKNANIPATTAIGSLDKDYRIDALKAGANVLMPNYTPVKFKELYEIYPNKRCLTEKPGACTDCFEKMARKIGRFIDYSKGDRVSL